MRHFRRRPRVDRKPDRTYVTQADTAIELELRARIEKKYPAHGVLAEEYGDRTSNQETRWIIDPIDATHSYLRGVPAFATLIALERAGVLEVGVMSAPSDLRLIDCEEVIVSVEEGLGLGLDRVGLVRKRRTLGARSDRGTWVRIEARPRWRVASQGWGGIEAAQVLTGIAKPEWYRSLSWRDADNALWWRADETELVTAAPINTGV